MQYKELMTGFEEIIVELSYNCNLSCTMCGFGKEVNPFHKSKFLPFDTYKTILKQIGNITKTIRLNGRGESTIHPDFVEIVNYTKQEHPNLNINLFSNFSFSNKNILNCLIDNQVQLFVSMDSSESEELSAIRKGARFNLIESNIKSLKDLPNRPFIIFTIQEANIHRIYDIGKFAFSNNCQILYNTIRRNQGIETFVDSVKVNYDAIAEQFTKVNHLYANSGLQCLCPDQLAGVEFKNPLPTRTHGTMNTCPALDKELCILYDGTATPCNMFNPYVYGNVFEQSLDEIWHGEQRTSFLNSHKDYYYCQNCANLGV
ncbi:MAG: SPASM domain-containing protein [Bacteroidia bacterium]|nr:SPASM domain-containing protein [Bacteroidia bacterium]